MRGCLRYVYQREWSYEYWLEEKMKLSEEEEEKVFEGAFREDLVGEMKKQDYNLRDRRNNILVPQ